MKVKELTTKQIDLFPEFIKKWTDIGLCTLPANRKEAERGIITSYQIAGLDPPKKIVWCGSPVSQGLTRAILFNLKKTEIGNSVRDSVGDSVWDSVWDSVRNSVGGSVWGSVWDSVRDSVRDSVGDSVGDSVRDSVWDSVGDSIYGQHDSDWLAFYDYFCEACGLSEETQKLTGLWQVAKSANWWLPHKNICWVSERHHILYKDDRGFLHCENGPALQYPDGWSIWAWHGVRVSQHIIEQPETITTHEIQKEQNEEVRRILIERMGWERWLRESHAKIIHRRFNNRDQQWEELYTLNNSKRLLVSDPSTGRKYALGVPSEINTCQDAQNWLSSGLDKFAIHRS
jgi:hypothetical protein